MGSSRNQPQGNLHTFDIFGEVEKTWKKRDWPDGDENVAPESEFAFFPVFVAMIPTHPLTSHVGEPSWSWFQGTISTVQKEK